MQRVWQRARRFAGAEEASSEVEYMMLLAFVVLPLCVVLPAGIVLTNLSFFERVSYWVNLPFP